MDISLAAEPIAYIGSFPVTNTLVMALLISLALVIFSVIVKLKLSRVPQGVQNFVELVMERVIDFMAGVTQNRDKAYKFFPLVFTIFIFVLLSNFIELLPGLGSIGRYAAHNGERVLVPFIRSASADLNVTLAIAIISVMATQIFGILGIGFFKYTKKFLNFTDPVMFFVGILELISELAKMISFSFRLFGNIFAGEVLLLVIGFLVPLIAPIPFLFLEIFVGFVQALVFAMLTLVFLTMANTEVH